MNRATPTPPQPDRDSVEYWRALAQGQLRIQRCDDCGLLRWPPRAVCAGCRSFRFAWVSPSGRGRVVSWAIAHRAFAPEYAEAVPYTVVTVELEDQEGLQLLGAWRGGREPRSGEAVRTRIEPLGEEAGLLCWEPCGGAAR